MAKTSETKIKIPALKIPALKIPKFKLSLNDFLQDSKTYTPILLVLLIVASFLLGATTTKLSMSDQTGSSEKMLRQFPALDAPGQPAAGTKVDVEIGHLPVLGDKMQNHSCRISDFQCPFCKQWVDQTKEKLTKDYVDTGKIKFAFRQYPIPQLHSNAQKQLKHQNAQMIRINSGNITIFCLKSRHWANLPTLLLNSRLMRDKLDWKANI